MKHRAMSSNKRRAANIFGVCCLVAATYFATASTTAKPQPQIQSRPSTTAAHTSKLVVVGNLAEGNLYAALFTKPNGWVKEFVNQGVRNDGKRCLETEEPAWYCGPRNGYALEAYCKVQTTDNLGHPEWWLAVAAPDEFVFKNGAAMATHNGQRVAYIDERFIAPSTSAAALADCKDVLNK